MYILLDTCVWLEMLKVDLHTEANIFDEMCYWIEKRELIHITPQNIIREWDRNKLKKTQEIIRQVISLNKNLTQPFKNNTVLSSLYNPESIEELITKRIEKVELILKNSSEIANESQQIYDKAKDRSLNGIAPNHGKDSFRDTINVLTLSDHVKTKGYSKCIFSTLNYTDFSVDKSNKHNYHSGLSDLFSGGDLQYVYFDDEENFGNKLLNVYLRPQLSSYSNFLKEKEERERVKKLIERKPIAGDQIENPDKDFIRNIKYIDNIITNPTSTDFEKETLENLIKRHPSYEQYFLRRVGDNGLV
jgi:hypothetical protein